MLGRVPVLNGALHTLPLPPALPTGDTMDDANFEHTTANGAILRLTKELAWIGGFEAH